MFQDDRDDFVQDAVDAIQTLALHCDSPTLLTLGTDILEYLVRMMPVCSMTACMQTCQQLCSVFLPVLLHLRNAEIRKLLRKYPSLVPRDEPAALQQLQLKDATCASICLIAPYLVALEALSLRDSADFGDLGMSVLFEEGSTRNARLQSLNLSESLGIWTKFASV